MYARQVHHGTTTCSAAALAAAAMVLLAGDARADAPTIDGWPEEVPRVRWWEWAGSASLLGGSLALRFGVDVSGEPNWKGGILIDEPLYDALFLEHGYPFRSWRTIGDVGYLGSLAWTAVDPLLAGVLYDWDTALQMAGMNLEAFSIYSMVLSLAQVAVRRERPATRECADPEHADELAISCGDDNPNRNRSFIGGHTGTAATAATLTCIHHIELPLWGRQADPLPCVTMWALTATVFTSRTLTGQHYFSDNFLGLAVGTGSAFIPFLLHHGMRRKAARSSATPRVRPTAVMVAPLPGGAALQLSGVTL